MGTAVTTEHLGLWKRFTHEAHVVLMFIVGHAADVEKMAAEGAEFAEAAAPAEAPVIASFTAAMQNLFGHVAAIATSADAAVTSSDILDPVRDAALIAQVKDAALAIKGLKLPGVTPPPVVSAKPAASTPAPVSMQA